MNQNITVQPIAYVHNERIEAIDDDWARVESIIELADDLPTNVLEGVDTFSHLEIIYFFHQVAPEKAVPRFRHPRNNKEWPQIGSFAQRNKSRPNRLGLCTVQLIAREGRRLRVRYLDAIAGTPVLDIKPVMKEFEIKGKIIQPEWASALMKNYWE